jgi:hypothetical protein
MNNQRPPMNTSELETIKMQIEKMDKTHHIEILKILKQDNSITLNENKSGVYVNLSFLPALLMDELKKYIQYTNAQEDAINSLEKQQTDLKNTFFSEKQDKDNVLMYTSATN